MTKDVRTAIVIGGSAGVGRAAVLGLAAAGRRVWAVGRDRARLDGLSRDATGPGEVLTRAFDATDAAAMDQLIDEADPDLVVLSAGARPRMALVQEQTWESFSAPWNTDLKIAFQIGQTALRRPLRPGSRVIFVSSGAGLGGSPLSGGYAGAKRMQMLLAGYLQRSADAAKLGIRFQALVPKQVLAESEMGAAVADAYAKLGGITPEKYMERFGAPLTPQAVGAAILQLAAAGEGDLPREGSLGPVFGLTAAGGLEAL
ncbi:MAG TPA: SDR family oxidoreductase [Polyangia bacterium]|nr:SDR family oxidoreductase [Polyangia bacterium]